MVAVGGCAWAARLREVARKAGRQLMVAVEANYPLPRDLVTRESLENACAAVAATGVGAGDLLAAMVAGADFALALVWVVVAWK